MPAVSLGVLKPAKAKDDVCHVALRPVPMPVTMDLGPNSSVTSRAFSAMRAYASSMVISSHLFSPRSPTRRSGCRMRSGWFTASTMARQRMHSLPSLTGERGSPSIFTSLSSLV